MTGGGEQMEGVSKSSFTPTNSSMGGKSFSHAEGGGGGTTRFYVVFTWGTYILAILKVCTKRCRPFKEGAEDGSWKVLPCLERGAKKFRNHDFPIL